MKKTKLLFPLIPLITLGGANLTTLASCQKQDVVDTRLTLKNEGENNAVVVFGPDTSETHPADLSYSADGGKTWTKLTKESPKFVIGPNQTAMLRGKNHDGFNTDESNNEINIIFETQSKPTNISIGGSLMGLIDNGGEDPVADNWTMPNACFQCLFTESEAITSVADDFFCHNKLQVLSQECYYHVFCDCERLTKAPKLPSTHLARGCYSYMFYGCRGLVQPPQLPANELVEKCYWGMFADCQSLAIAPQLNATKLAPECYKQLFYDCKSLKISEETTVPTRTLFFTCPNETLPEQATENMFRGTTGEFTNHEPFLGRKYYFGD